MADNRTARRWPTELPCSGHAVSRVEVSPVRRNRVWQADFSALETTEEGTWQLCAVVDYATKVALACPVTATQTATDLLAAFEAAIAAAEALLDRLLIEDCTETAYAKAAAPSAWSATSANYESASAQASRSNPPTAAPTSASAPCPECERRWSLLARRDGSSRGDSPKRPVTVVR